MSTPTPVGGAQNVTRAVWDWLRPSPVKPPPWTIVITGASVGIGLALYRALADSPHRLVLTARPGSMGRFAELGLVESERLLLRSLDVTEKSQQRAMVDELVERFGAVDVLVNNAGICFRSVVEHVSTEERLAQTDVNFLAPMALTKLCLPAMRAQRFGRVVNVSSLGGLSAMPTLAVYSASKYALEGASEALWYEVRPFNITVCLIEPGFVNSDGFLKARFTAAAQRSYDDPTDPYHRHYRQMLRLTKALMTLTMFSSDSVARRIRGVILARDPPLRVAGTPDAWLFGMARRLLPQRLYHLFLYAGLPRVWEWGGRRGPHPR
ncbi:MAG: short-subunit dehydrogenase [Myxococcota bacterium]|jgi:short-subunit dehydrogenase